MRATNISVNSSAPGHSARYRARAQRSVTPTMGATHSRLSMPPELAGAGMPCAVPPEVSGTPAPPEVLCGLSLTAAKGLARGRGRRPQTMVYTAAAAVRVTTSV